MSFKLASLSLQTVTGGLIEVSLRLASWPCLVVVVVVVVVVCFMVVVVCFVMGPTGVFMGKEEFPGFEGGGLFCFESVFSLTL